MADIPPPLKSIAPFISLSKQFKQRDAIVSYYSKSSIWAEECTLYAVYNHTGLLYGIQQGISLSKGNDSAKQYLLKTMEDLETVSTIVKQC